VELLLTDLSIVLPCYNEKDNIVPLVRDLLSQMDFLGGRLEILVVDDNSPDGTAQLVRQGFAQDGRVKTIVRTANRGLAFSIREGLEQACGRILLVMDTDFNHPPSTVPVLFHVAEYADLVVGSRFIFGGGMPDRTRYYLSYIYNIFMRLALGTRIDDNLSGLFAIRREALQRLPFERIFWGYGDYFFRLLLLAQRMNMRVIQIPVMYGLRPAGEAKTRFLSIFSGYTREVLRLVWQRFQK
jgi:dolichol-phosphate mannosyltransferase